MNNKIGIIGAAINVLTVYLFPSNWNIIYHSFC